MIAPLPLKPGNKIGLIAPSRKVTSQHVEGTTRLLEEWGYQVVLSQNVYKAEHQFAGTDLERANDFMQMITDPEIKAILAVRGGYGTIRILEYLDAALIRKNPKWIIGYSDITALHSYFHQVIECETIHATMPVNFSPVASMTPSWQKLREVLNGDSIGYEVPGHDLNRSGKTMGMLVGGNLSVLFSLRGTYCDIDTEDKILFIEDIDEYLYHIDRMMMNLKIGGKLKNLKGLIVGGMTDMKDNSVPFGKNSYEIIADAVKDYDYPVLFDFPAGHTESNVPLLLGKSIELEVHRDKGMVKFENWK
jgi:muramoyltetrapeptide carboxypeptidase